MNQTAILLTSMTIGIVGWVIIGRIWIVPWLRDNSLRKGLMLLTVPHIFRYIALSFLIVGVTTSPLDPRFAIPAAYGDLLSSILAVIAVLALLAKSSYSIPIVWIFNVVGFIDFIIAITQFLRYSHPAELGATYFIPILAVPLIFVSHLLIFWTLITRNRKET